MFEKAARLKLRFDTTKGPLTTEDLFDLPLTSTAGKVNLDDIARALYRQAQSADSISFVTPASTGDETIKLKLDIVKHVIGVKVAENQAAATLRANKEKKARLVEMLERKEDEALAGKSADEIRAMIEAL